MTLAHHPPLRFGYGEWNGYGIMAQRVNFSLTGRPAFFTMIEDSLLW